MTNTVVTFRRGEAAWWAAALVVTACLAGAHTSGTTHPTPVTETALPPPRPPTITLDLPSEAYIDLGRAELVLPFECEGYPEPEVQWNRDDYPIAYDALVALRNDSLVLSAPSELSEGYYQCLCSNQYGTAVSRITHVQMPVLENFLNADATTLIRARFGDTLTLQCNPPDSKPPATYSWGLLAVGSLPGTSPVPLPLNSRIQIDGEGNLMFSDAIMSDGGVTVRYVCMATNQQLQHTVYGSLHSISVTHGARIPRRPVIMYNTPSPVIGYRGDDVILFCFFGGYPTPEVQWMKKNGDLPINSRVSFSHAGTKLHIRAVRYRDSGTYVCVGSSDAGRSDEVQIYLHVDAKPDFLPDSQPVNMNFTSGEDAMIRCEADAKPPARNTWYINGQLLKADSLPSRMSMSNDSTTLTIHSLCTQCDTGAVTDNFTAAAAAADAAAADGREERGSDFMVVQCNASNTHGYAFAQGYLSIFDSPSPPASSASSTAIALSTILHYICYTLMVLVCFIVSVYY